MEKIIRQIVEIDTQLSNNRFDHKLTTEQCAKLRAKRDRLEKKLHK